ncbi:hypothetical protein BU17DRAFT_81519 [Hysterangium stoloniferum]|nr:hypothetical protein BU17DRAFT_81519 [Hysterangium stoloniferum]
MSNQSDFNNQGSQDFLELELLIQSLYHEQVPAAVFNDPLVEDADLDQRAVSQTFRSPPLYLGECTDADNYAPNFRAVEGLQLQVPYHSGEYDSINADNGTSNFAPSGPTGHQPHSEFLTGNSPFVSPQFSMYGLPPVASHSSTAATTPIITTPALPTTALEDTPPLHIYGQVDEGSHSPRRIVDTTKLDSWIRPCDGPGGNKKEYQCTWAQCRDQTFERRDQARKHICKHLGIDKEYGCDTCDIQFSSYRAAKRHSKARVKQHGCRICGKKYARKDYWRSHEKRCLTRNTPPMHHHHYNEREPSFGAPVRMVDDSGPGSTVDGRYWRCHGDDKPGVF